MYLTLIFSSLLDSISSEFFTVILGSLAVLILLAIGLTSLIKYKHKFDYVKPTKKVINRPSRINFVPVPILYGIYAGRYFITDINSLSGVGVLRLGPNPNLMQFLWGNRVVWGILSSTPNTTLSIFRINAFAVMFVGEHRVLYRGVILSQVHIYNGTYEVVGQGLTSRAQIIFANP